MPKVKVSYWLDPEHPKKVKAEAKKRTTKKLVVSESQIIRNLIDTLNLK